MGGARRARSVLRVLRLFLTILICPAAAAAAPRLVLNEILYDPEGADLDREFVELYVDGDGELLLDGIELHFVNGAAPQLTERIWSAPAHLTVPAGSFVVIGEEGVQSRHYTAQLDLQNGPDALLLMRGASILDAVAWGEVEGRGEGDPAFDVSGRSLGRVPDGFDTDDNARDFRELPRPSPGAINLPSSVLRLISLDVDPPWAPRLSARRLRVEILAEGYGPEQSGSIELEPGGQTTDLRIARGDTARIELWVTPTETRWRARLILTSDSSPHPDVEWPLLLVSGPQSIVLNEVMAWPRSGEPEWIELHNRSPDDVDLAGYLISDRNREPRALLDPGILLAGSYLVLCNQPQELLAARRLPDDVQIVQVQGGWPTLNNAPSGGDSIADEVHLIDGSAATVDWLAYGAGLIAEAGRSMERGLVSESTPDHWFVAPSEASPGRANSSAAVPPPAEEGVQALPNPFSPDGDGRDDVLHVWLRLPPGMGSPRAEILDLVGDRVCTLEGGEGENELRQWIWDGTDQRGQRLPSGAYLVRIEAQRQDGSVAEQWVRLVALGKRR